MALQSSFPALKIEGGPYTPPQAVQYGIRAVRFAQAGVAVGFFFGEQLFGLVGRPAPPIISQMHENKLVTAAGVYGLDVIAQTMKSINAFEITYNGQVLHSKLKSGRFPEPSELVAKLQAVIKQTPQEAEA